MNLIETIHTISREFNTILSPEEIEEILFLLKNDASLFHLFKINREEAVQEAILYITPDF